MSAMEGEEMEVQTPREESEDMDEDNESDDDSGDLSDDKEEELREKVKELRIQISRNHLFYDGHVKLIAALRELVELEEARQARETMSKIYPLSPDLWLEWVRDEQKVCTTREERDYIANLFDRAVKDYTSVQVWVEYVMFMLGGGDVEATRSVGDRALTAVGTHVSEGILVWQVVQLVEKQIYAGMKKSEGSQSEQDKIEEEKQLRRIQNLCRRQVRVPLLNTDPHALLEESSEYFNGTVESQMKLDMEKTHKKFNVKIRFEDDLLKCQEEVDKLSMYRRYITHTHESDNPAAVQSLYERAVTDHCLDAGLWEEYVRYCLRQFPGLDYVVLPVCERSQRNCPWSSTLCMLHIRALQLFAPEGDSNLTKKIKGALEKGLGCGLQAGSEATSMWMSYLVYLRRFIDWDKAHDAQLKALREACQQAIDMIDGSYGEGDIDSEIPRFWARVEGESARNPERMRGIWNDIIMKRNDNFKNANFWLEFINLERSYGTEKHTRKLFRRALERVWDNVELIGDAYLRFEQEVGTLDTMEDFIRRYEDRMTIVRRKRDDDAARLDAEKEAEESRIGKQKDRGKKMDKRKHSADRQTNGHSQGGGVFKTPFEVPQKVKGVGSEAPLPGSKMEPPPPLGFNSDVNCDVATSPGYMDDVVPPPGYDVAPPPDFKGDVAPPPGFKGDVAPPPGFKGDVAPPPGFKGDVAPPPGFKGDVTPPPGFKRKAEDSDDESETKKAKLAEQYGILADKEADDDLCTVFVSNLEFSIDKEEIIPLFAACGEIKDFRLVRDFKRRSKGYGYLVFKTQSAVKNALEKDRTPLNGRPVYVSRYDTEGQTHHFKYPTALEKNKLFIRGLPFDMSQDDIKEAFLPHGEIKEMRLVNYRNGFSKGTCYIEYHDANTAEKVREAMDGQELRDKVINVVISNPPSKNTFGMPIVREVALGGGTNKGKYPPGGRKKGMFDLMPRSLMRASTSSSSSSTSADTKETTTDAKDKPKSNEDFRKMLLKK